MARTRPSRREMLERCITGGLLVAGAPLSQTQLLALYQTGEAQSQKATPAEVLGPFFKKGAPDAKVLRVSGESGFPLRVSGKVWNTRGALVPEARVDVWHADHFGHYDLKGYKYRTKLAPDSKGVYAIETVMPGHYPDRPAQHVHYLISAPGHKTLVTQLYFATDPFFEGNPEKNFGKRAIVGNRELVRPVQLFEGPEAPHASVDFDLVLETA